MFKTFFRKNPKMLKKIIGMSLGIEESEIKNITYLNNELIKDNPRDKLGIVDLLVEINNSKKINIEIQNVEKHNFSERVEFYLSRIYVEDLEKGSDYKEVKEVCGIYFLNYDDKNYPNFFSVIKNCDIINKRCTKNLKTIVVYNLSKIDEIDKYDFREEEKYMLRFIESKNEEELNEMAEKSVTLNEAMEQLRKINSDSKLKRLLFYADLQRLDENTKKRHEKELEDNIETLENNVQSLENNVQILMNALYKNNSIEEISRMTNLEIDYIKNMLNQ